MYFRVKNPCFGCLPLCDKITSNYKKNDVKMPNFNNLANALRFLAIDAVETAQSGHPGMPMGMADVATVLFTQFLRFNPADSHWPNRDRFVLSNGHGSMLQYALLHLTGYDVSLDSLKNFRQLNSPAAGHPEFGHMPGIETTTGPLGQGFANAVGMALAQEMSATRGEPLNNKTYVVVGDGCLMEGLSHEAAELAGHLRLKNLIVLFDSNGISIDGPTSLSQSTNIHNRFAAYGFNVLEVDGHNPDAIATVLREAQTAHKPTFIICHTHIGFGSGKQDTAKAHGEPLGKDEVAATRTKLNWPHAPFEIPAEIRAAWLEAGKRSLPDYKASQHKATKVDTAALLSSLCTNKDSLSTRKASGLCLEKLAANLPQLILGSADLTPSNNTKTAAAKPITADDFSGNYIHYGIREHAMAAVMNGLALYGNIIPAGGTFLCFLDYMKPAVRLTAVMGKQVVYIFTHDSIGLGEDGPTHQPIEHLASLRALPNMVTLRPADLVETAAAWHTAINRTDGPTALILSRQNLPALTKAEHFSFAQKGGYVISPEGGKLQGIFIATGSEVQLAIAAQQQLAAQGIHTRVVSLLSWELFRQQPQKYRDDILPPIITARVGIEAAAHLGWHEWLGLNGKFIGMHSFGASAPATDLFNHFNITADAATTAMKELLS